MHQTPAEPRALPTPGQPWLPWSLSCLPVCVSVASRGLCQGMGGVSCHLLPLDGVEKDMLTAQPGLDFVSVSCRGSRTSGPPGLGARLERGALEGKAPEVPAERRCQEVSRRGSSVPSLDLAICQGCRGFKQPHTG